MLREKEKSKQDGLELIHLESMIPPDHLLRKINDVVDFSFIRELCKDLYCSDNGRPAIDPELLFRMLFLGYLYGIKSERRLEEEVNYNIAYKWFLGLKIIDRAPDHSTISANRKRRFEQHNLAEKIFDEILRQAMRQGLVGGAILFADSTHVKAKANKHKKHLIEVKETPQAYWRELDEQIELDRKALGKKSFHDKDDDDTDDLPPGSTTTRMESKTDPESGQLSKEGKPDGFHYSEHRTVDSKHNIIVNVHITPANENDVSSIPQQLIQIEKRLGKMPDYMVLDAGYHNAAVCKQLKDAHIQGVIGYRRHTHEGEHLGKYRFYYDDEFDAYSCPQGRHLYWKTTNRAGYREYWSNAKICTECPRRAECFSDKATRRLVSRHVWQDHLDQVTAFTKTPIGKRIYAWRKETIERSFAEAKENHGLRYSRMLGLAGMREQSFLTATVQNIKRIVKASSGFIFFRFFLPLIPKTPALA